MINKRHALRGNALVIELVIAQQVFRTEFPHRGVVHDAQETRQNWFADFFRKCLALGGIFLTVALSAMAKDLMEKDRSRAAGQERWSNRRLVNWRCDETLEFLAHRSLCGGDGLVVRRIRGIDPVEIVITVDVHSVR